MKFIPILITFLILLSCNKDDQLSEELIVNFETTLDSEEVPATLTVKNLSKGATSYAWKFVGGDPDNSTEYDPEGVIYNSAGNFEISLTGQNQKDTITAIKKIQLLNKLIVDFEIELSNTVVPTEINLINNSIGADSYQWSFEEGDPESSTLENPKKIVYEKEGDHQVTLTISKNGRERSVTKTIKLTDHIIVESSWFSVDFIKPDTYIFRENSSSQGNVSYLILGEEKVIMFDTGSGENSAIDGLKIKNYVGQISGLPVTLLLSHFHFDHNQNIAEFDHVAFPSLPFLEDKVGSDNIYIFSEEELFLGSTPAQVTVDEWMPINEEINLGNRMIELINIQGHTDESIAILDNTNKLAFLGDFLYSGELFIFDLEKYETSVDYLLANIPSDYRLFGAHGNPEVSYDQLNKLKSAIASIKSGDCSFEASSILGKPVQLYDCDGFRVVLFV